MRGSRILRGCSTGSYDGLGDSAFVESSGEPKSSEKLGAGLAMQYPRGERSPLKRRESVIQMSPRRFNNRIRQAHNARDLAHR